MLEERRGPVWPLGKAGSVCCTPAEGEGGIWGLFGKPGILSVETLTYNGVFILKVVLER